MSNFINIENLSFRYNENDNFILKDINLSINKGEFIALMGKNGCGKSTLLKHLNGLLLPTTGKVLVDGIDTKSDAMLSIIRSKVGIVLQDPSNQIISSVVEDDVAFGPENLGVAPDEIRARVDKALKMVELYDFKEFDTNSLSGGQKQRLAIAGILAMNPSCIILDEPTSMLDPRGKKEILNILKSLNKEHKITIILVTHDINEAIFSDRIIVLDNGSIALNDMPETIFKNPKVLENYDVCLPDFMALLYRLKKQGFDVKAPVLTIEDCVFELCKILKGRSICD